MLKRDGVVTSWQAESQHKLIGGFGILSADVRAVSCFGDGPFVMCFSDRDNEAYI